MAQHDHKPTIYKVVQKWALPTVAVVYIVATVCNLLLHPVAEWILLLIVGPIGGVAGHWIVRGVLRFQKVNALTMRRETYDSFVAFSFWFGLLFVGLVLLSVVLGGGSNLFMLYGLTLPAGMSSGAARQWEFRQHFRSKGEPAG